MKVHAAVREELQNLQTQTAHLASESQLWKPE
jgi:hypothetical protein